MTVARDRSERELMELHVAALFTHDDRGRLRAVNEPGGDRAPRFFLGRTPAGSVRRFRDDLPDDLVAELDRLCAEEPAIPDPGHAPVHAAEYRRLLEDHAPVESVGGGPAYRFPERLPPPSTAPIRITEENRERLRPGFEEWVPDVGHCQPFLAVVVGDRRASLCCSVRITPHAHEAGVETLPEFRRRGYARDAVAAWASAVRDLDRVPLYSTSWENAASQGLAASLSLVRYGVDFSIR